jgi:ketosteroid isomerase-like protein
MSRTDTRSQAGIIRAMFTAVDSAENADELVRSLTSFLTDDVVFVIGNEDPLEGKDSVARNVTEALTVLEKVRHEIHDVWQAAEDADVLIAQMTTHHTRLDGKSVSVPSCHVFRMRGNLVAHSQTYMDATPVFA